MALATLQNEVYHEAAQSLARRIQADRTLQNDRERVDRLYRLVLARHPGAAEREIVIKLLADNRAHYRDHPDAARELCKEGTTELAAWIATVRIITNLDEFITCS